jgi:hypothetical protein
MARPPINRVSKGELRLIFNRLYLADMLAGRMTEIVCDEGEPNPRMNQPAGTRSQIVHLLDAEGRKVAVIHRYVLPGGALGGSGKPDPKNVLAENGVLYAGIVSPPPPSARAHPRRRRGGKGKRK